MSLKVKAYIDTVLVTEIERETERVGIVLPNEVSLGPKRGMVESAGPDVPELVQGMIVYYCDHDHQKIGKSTVIHAGCVMAYEEE